MSKYQIPTPAPGEKDLPDLILRVAGRQAHTYPQTAETLPLDLLPPQTSRFETTPYEPTYSAMDYIPRTMLDTAPASFILQLHHGHSLNLGYNTIPQQNNSTTATTTGPAPANSACASCSEWSLACRPAAAATLLDTCDEHDPYSDRRRAARTVQQLVHLQKRHRDSEDARPQLQHRTKSAHANLTPPMLRRWFREPQRQECFSGLAAMAQARASVSTVGAIKSRL